MHDITVSAQQIKDRMWIFVDMTIENSTFENSTFDSQTKETLTTPAKFFRFNLSPEFMQKASKIISVIQLKS